jgi:hypothetical protein
MGMKAEELGVEIYPGFAASEVLLVLLACDPSAYYWMVCNTSYVICQILYDANDKVIGIATNDMGVAKDGSKKENYQRGVELKGISLSLSHTHTHTHTHTNKAHTNTLYKISKTEKLGPILCMYGAYAFARCWYCHFRTSGWYHLCWFEFESGHYHAKNIEG